MNIIKYSFLHFKFINEHKDHFKIANLAFCLKGSLHPCSNLAVSLDLKAAFNQILWPHQSCYVNRSDLGDYYVTGESCLGSNNIFWGVNEL